MLFRANGPDKIIFQVERAGLDFDRDRQARRVRRLCRRRRRPNSGSSSSARRSRRRGISGVSPAARKRFAGQRPAIAVGASSHSGKVRARRCAFEKGLPRCPTDMMVVDFSSEKPMVLPGYQKLRLWNDACEQLGLKDRAIAKALHNVDKFVLATVASPANTPVPLTDLFVLSGQRRGQFQRRAVGSVQGLRFWLPTHWLDAARARWAARSRSSPDQCGWSPTRGSGTRPHKKASSTPLPAPTQSWRLLGHDQAVIGPSASSAQPTRRRLVALRPSCPAI